MPEQGCRFGTPLLLESIGALAGGGAAKIEERISLVRSVFKKCPVEQHVGIRSVQMPVCGSPRNGNGLAVAEDHAAGCRLPVGRVHDAAFCPAPVFFKHTLKPAFTVDRGAEIPHVFDEHRVKIVQQLSASDLYIQSILLRFAYLTSQF